jgi:hypothetical protein
LRGKTGSLVCEAKTMKFPVPLTSIWHTPAWHTTYS